MYYLKKTITISAAHSLSLTYQSPCQNLHGHNWKITVYCKSKTLDENGMIVDFSHIKKIVNELDHQDISNIIPKNSTAEHIAEWLCYKIPYCYQVDVEETENNIISFIVPREENNEKR